MSECLPDREGDQRADPYYPRPFDVADRQRVAQANREYIIESMDEFLSDPDAPNRDLVAVIPLERLEGDMVVLRGEDIIGEILGVDDTHPRGPSVIIGNAVRYTETEDGVRTIHSANLMEAVPLDMMGDPLITFNSRSHDHMDLQWHKDYFSSTDI